MILVGLLGGETAGVSVVGHLPSGLPLTRERRPFFVLELVHGLSLTKF
jgi:hypothetical protein